MAVLISLSRVSISVSRTQFYEDQAQIYDATRNGLLRGRKTMLNLSAAHLRAVHESTPKKRLVWVDIGGGTGTINYELPLSCSDA